MVTNKLLPVTELFGSFKNFYDTDNSLNMAGIFRLSSVTILQPDQVVLLTNLFFKIDILLPLVTGELLQNTVDATSVTYKLYNIKI